MKEFKDKHLQFCVQCKEEFRTDEPLAEKWETLRCDKCLNKIRMKAEHYKKQIEFNLKVVEDYMEDELTKEVLNLIFNVQQYCEKGGKEHLW